MSPPAKRKRLSTPSPGASGKARPGRANGKRPEDQGPPLVGKRPSNPGFLAAIAVMWFVAAIAAVFIIHAAWKAIPVIVFAGIGFLYLRGAAGAYSRREPPGEGK